MEVAGYAPPVTFVWRAGFVANHLVWLGHQHISYTLAGSDPRPGSLVVRAAGIYLGSGRFGIWEGPGLNPEHFFLQVATCKVYIT